MTKKETEDRIAVLEREVEELKRRLSVIDPPPQPSRGIEVIFFPSSRWLLHEVETSAMSRIRVIGVV